MGTRRIHGKAGRRAEALEEVRKALDLDPAAGDRLDRHVELVPAITIDVVHEDLLGVPVSQRGHDLPALSGGRDVADHLSRLGIAVELVGQARRRVDLQGPVGVEVAHLDLVDEGVLLAVQLLHREAAFAIGPDHGHDPLVVGRHDHVGGARAVHVGDLAVAHARELPAEVLLPESPGVSALWPVANDGGGAAEGEDARLTGGRAVFHDLVEDVALRVDQGPVLPGPFLEGQKRRGRGLGNLLPLR